MKNFLLFVIISVIFGCSNPVIVRETRETFERVEKMINTPKIEDKIDPTATESMIFKKKLEEMKPNLIAMEEGKKEVDWSWLKKVGETLEVMVLNYQKGLSEVIHEDVSFLSGKHSVNDITANGQNVLNGFSQKVTNELVSNFKQAFPESKLKVFIRVVGYADSVAPRGQLEGSLKPLSCLYSSKNNIPTGEEGSRLLNRELSCLRAKSIEEYLRKHVESNFPRDDKKLELADISNEGRGEESPYKFTNSTEEPYRQEDERRRICKIYANVFVE